MANEEKWWEALDEKSKNILLINYVFEYRFSEQLKRDLIVTRVNPFDVYKIKLQMDFKPFEVNSEQIKLIAQMGSLYASGCKLNDVEFLNNLKKLRKIDLSYNPGLNFSAIQNIATLEVLILERCSISDLSPIRNLTNLKELYLRDNYIRSIDDLAKLKNIVCLDIGVNEISNLEVIKNFPDLKQLYCDYNLIEIVEFMPDAQIEILDLSYNKIAAAGFAFKLNHLKKLNIKENKLDKNSYDWELITNRKIELIM